MKRSLLRYLNGNLRQEEIDTLSDGEIRRIKFINYISLISIVNMMSYTVLYMTLNATLFHPAIVFLSLSSLLLLGVIVLNNAGHRWISKILVALLNPIFISSVSTWIFGKDPGFHTFLFAAVIIPLFLWSIKDAIYLGIFSGLSLLLYIAIEFFPLLFDPLIQLPDSYIQVFKSSNILITICAIAVAFITYFELTNRQERGLEQQAIALEKAQQHRDLVYSIVAHDLRSPLARLFGVTGLFLKLYKNEKSSQELNHLKTIHNSSKTLNNLLDNLLSWSKLQSGRMIIEQESVNLSKIVKEAELLMADLLKEKKVAFINQLDQDVNVISDPNMMATVLRNIFSNAIKFTPEGGKIEIGSSKKNNMVEVSITDTGVGISEENLKLLFTEKAHLTTRGTAKEKGSGLGLKLCKDFIEANGGKIWAHSVDGKGSKFTFTLKSA